MPIHENTRRCDHKKVDGARCGSPALTGKSKCHFHIHIYRRPTEFVLPPLEDANSIQVAVMEIMRALLEDRLERDKAATLLYALQIAQSNLRRITLVRDSTAESEHEASLAEILLKELRECEVEPSETSMGSPDLVSVTTGSRSG
jgi:hypothetical protein